MVLGSVVGLALVAGGITVAQDHPERDISRNRHPNLAAAQRLTDQAFYKITAAQEANEWDIDGHAAKTKELIEQANRELKSAAEAANHNRR
jgi:hypothetical protein